MNWSACVNFSVSPLINFMSKISKRASYYSSSLAFLTRKHTFLSDSMSPLLHAQSSLGDPQPHLVAL